MSTADKLSPMGKTAAKRRAQAIKEMEGFAHMQPRGSVPRLRMASLADALRQVHQDSRFSGAQKDEKFKALLNRAKK